MGWSANTKNTSTGGMCLNGWDCAVWLDHRTAPRNQFFCLACLSLSFSLAQTLTLLSLSVLSRWFASTHCHPSVRSWPIKLAPAPISLLQFCWLFLDSIPPLISSSEISLHGSRGLVVGCWGLEGRDGVRREEAERWMQVLLDIMAPMTVLWFLHWQNYEAQGKSK